MEEPCPNLLRVDVGQVWEDEHRTIRQIFSIWRGDVTYGFIKQDTGEFGSCSCPYGKFIQDYAKSQRWDIDSIETILLGMSNLIIEEVNEERRIRGLPPTKAIAWPAYPEF